MSLLQQMQAPRMAQMLAPELEPEKAVRSMNLALRPCQCEFQIQHAGCPLKVFGFDKGRYMCDVYLQGFSG
jgi:hypothetical protein